MAYLQQWRLEDGAQQVNRSLLAIRIGIRDIYRRMVLRFVVAFHWSFLLLQPLYLQVLIPRG